MIQNTSNKQLVQTDQEVEWITQARVNPAAFKPLYEMYFKKIYLFIRRRVGDKDLSGDLSQQVFLKALSHIGKYEMRGIPFSIWLYRIAINQCNEFFRKSKHIRTVVLEEEWVEKFYEEITADQTLDQWEMLLPSILEKLNQADLEVIELRFFEGHSFREVGELLGISETYAKVRTYRVLEKMKKLFLQRK